MSKNIKFAIFKVTVGDCGKIWKNIHILWWDSNPRHVWSIKNASAKSKESQKSELTYNMHRLSTCPLDFGYVLLDHVIFVKLRKK